MVAISLSSWSPRGCESGITEGLGSSMFISVVAVLVCSYVGLEEAVIRCYDKLRVLNSLMQPFLTLMILV